MLLCDYDDDGDDDDYYIIILRSETVTWDNKLRINHAITSCIISNNKIAQLLNLYQNHITLLLWWSLKCDVRMYNVYLSIIN